MTTLVVSPQTRRQTSIPSKIMTGRITKILNRGCAQTIKRYDLWPYSRHNPIQFWNHTRDCEIHFLMSHTNSWYNFEEFGPGVILSSGVLKSLLHIHVWYGWNVIKKSEYLYMRWWCQKSPSLLGYSFPFPLMTDGCYYLWSADVCPSIMNQGKQV